MGQYKTLAKPNYTTKYGMNQTPYSMVEQDIIPEISLTIYRREKNNEPAELTPRL